MDYTSIGYDHGSELRWRLHHRQTYLMSSKWLLRKFSKIHFLPFWGNSCRWLLWRNGGDVSEIETRLCSKTISRSLSCFSYVTNVKHEVTEVCYSIRHRHQSWGLGVTWPPDFGMEDRGGFMKYYYVLKCTGIWDEKLSKSDNFSEIERFAYY